MQSFLSDKTRKGHGMKRDYKGNTVVRIDDEESQVARVENEYRIIITFFYYTGRSEEHIIV
jgi:hypothetical protein